MAQLKAMGSARYEPLKSTSLMMSWQASEIHKSVESGSLKPRLSEEHRVVAAVIGGTAALVDELNRHGAGDPGAQQQKHHGILVGYNLLHIFLYNKPKKDQK